MSYAEWVRDDKLTQRKECMLTTQGEYFCQEYFYQSDDQQTNRLKCVVGILANYFLLLAQFPPICCFYVNNPHAVGTLIKRYNACVDSFWKGNQNKLRSSLKDLINSLRYMLGQMKDCYPETKEMFYFYSDKWVQRMTEFIDGKIPSLNIGNDNITDKEVNDVLKTMLFESEKKKPQGASGFIFEKIKDFPNNNCKSCRQCPPK